ncbi:alpha-2-macroglobulin [Lewinella sp. LCG006]|uniref:alpha-2-macroglobulin family protein n=1 Tax=Lewinella sp. LCG006 TaxID=3231911 RepID=UPI003460968C
MSILLLLTITSLMAQDILSNEPFTREWKNIDSLYQQGLPESAGVALLELKGELAGMKDDNPLRQAHEIKVLLYELVLEARQEQGEWNALQILEELTAYADQPAKAIYQSYLAEKYLNYWQNHRWQIDQRTELSDATPTDDETTWSSQNFVNRITELYLSSLTATELRDKDLAAYGPLVVPGENADDLRPSIYDLLLDRALQYFRNNDAFLGEPAYEPLLDNVALLGPVKDFVTYELPSSEKATSFHRTLDILQEALSWSLRIRPNSKAHLDLDLTRLELIYRQLDTEDRHDAYRKSLNSLQKQHQQTPQEAMVLKAMMNFHEQQGQTYQPDQPELEALRWEYQKAVAIARDIRARFPKEQAASDATNLLNRILRPELQTTIEAVQMPQTPGLVQLSYNNVEQVFLKAIPITSEEYHDQNKTRQKLQAILSKKASLEWSEQLPQPGDFRVHTVETALQGLQPGVYCLAIATKADFSFDEGATSMIYFWVSELAVVQHSDREDNYKVIVVNRRTGQPVPNATVKVWVNNRRNRNEEPMVQHAVYQSDRDGQVTIKGISRDRVALEIITETDRLFPSEYFWLYSNSYDRQQKPPPYTVFFTDRGLYRPGQIVYFKALALQQDKEVPAIVPNAKFSVSLLDGNSQEVATIALKTNEFGSASGQFTLPAGGLLGSMYLKSSLGNGSAKLLRVEEYKRPRFEVDIADLKAEPRLRDTVEVEGVATAYAGPAIADAKVSYTVVREVVFPWYRGYGRYFPSYHQPQTLATGTTTTDAEGKFAFDFFADPDEAVEKNRFPLYYFKVNVEVVDGTGETRMANKDISLTEYPFQLNLNLASSFDKQEGLVFDLSCQNLDGFPLKKEVMVNVKKLDSPARTFVDRYWGRPDLPLLKEKTFRKYFPQFTYEKKEEKAYWPEGAEVFSTALTLAGRDSLTISAKDWSVGHYRVTLLTVTPQGDTLQTSQDFQVHDWSKGEFAVGEWLYTRPSEGDFEPGAAVALQLGQQAGDIKVFSVLQNRSDAYWERWLSGGERIEYQLTEADRGGLSWSGFYVANSRFYQTSAYWSVPWSNKDLDITFETFRSKIYPDAEEEFILRIDGPDKERIATEVLASMYDASLDQIAPFSWQFPAYPTGMVLRNWQTLGFQQLQDYSNFNSTPIPVEKEMNLIYPRLWTNTGYGSPSFMLMMDGAPMGVRMRSSMAFSEAEESDAAVAKSSAENTPPSPPPPPPPAPYEAITSSAGSALPEGPAPTKIRTNLGETAFFFPQLATDAEGRVVLKFRAPESLTRWKLQLFGHSKDLAYSLSTEEVVTQKELMILPNAPRFLREGDQMTFTAKVSNLSDKVLSGEAVLELFDVQTNEGIASAYGLKAKNTSFNLATGASETVSWSLTVPKKAAGVLGYRVIARAGNFSDGEEAALPVLTNRILLTEAQPLFVRPKQTKTFTLERLQNADASTDQYAFQLDITSNPAWEAIKALPYLQEYPYDCTEQIVNRMFANSLASKVVKDYPKIRDVFAAWRNDGEALKSPLFQNEELKTALLEETPWVMEAKSESLQRERIALLFDLDRLANEQAVAQRKLLDRQSPNGAFSWFPGGPEQWYMTQYVVEQLSHLRQLTGEEMNYELRNALENAMRYCDQQAYKWYSELKEAQKKDKVYSASPQVIHYLYTRSMNLDIDLLPAQMEMYEYCWSQVTEHWLAASLYEQALIALAAKYSSREELANKIFASLKERSLHTEEMGRYWKQSNGYYWYQNNVETHVRLLELFAAMNADEETLSELKIWLLRNKETNRWETTKATAAAVFGLVSTGDNWLGETTPLEVSFPNWSKSAYEDKVAAAQENAEAGTGAYQVRWTEEEVQPAMATIRLRNRSKAPGWGALYWQYFTNIDAVTRDADNPLRIERTLYQRVNNGDGEVLQALTKAPQAGDRITVRLVVRNDRALEYVHLKDLRASGLEPLDQLSSYRYQGGLGYYQQTTDLGTHFFFHWLPAGEYVLEYDLVVFHQGDFSGGLSTIQCMYAPKFVSHSEGTRLQVGE